MHSLLVRSARRAIPLYAITESSLTTFLASRPKREAQFLKSSRFAAQEGDLRLLPSPSGEVAGAVLGLGKGEDNLALAQFCEQLPAGTYRIAEAPGAASQHALGWLLGSYQFARYRKAKINHPKLVLPQGVDGEEITRVAEAIFLARDLIATPPNDMGPEELSDAVRSVASKYNAKFSVIVGEALLKKNYPLIHAVGMGSTRAPRLAAFTWGPKGAPKLTLIGKGVCFDTGGYDLKSAAGMVSMKKDMGGAATALALASMVMGAKLNVRLRVLIPAVENSVSGTAYRPSDVFSSRKGLSVEIGNTDAEGRLVLADALADADDEAPDLLIDIATLTGAARVATGFELPPFFTDDETLASNFARHAVEQNDPVWRLPLWRGYEATLNSQVADLTNNPNYGYAGAITAALFLNRFVEKAKSWMHIDIAAWIDRPKPGRRAGAEATAARALYALLRERYAN